MNDESNTSVLKIVQNEKKWLINVSEEPTMMNAILDDGRCFTHVFI